LGYGFAGLLNHPGKFPAQDGRVEQFAFHRSLPHLVINGVERGGFDADQHLVVGHRRRIHLGQRKLIRRAEAAQHDCFHGK
jgi:hypothetical protein